MVLPANVLARNPAVMSAERELAAAWADIGVARAERLPRLNLVAILTGQWLRVAGTSSDTTTGSLGFGLSAPLFDGGRGKATVGAAQARYHRAAADLEIALRQAWRDVENSLSALEAAQLRHHSARESLRASIRLLTASEAQWRAGAISLFELEDARRRYAQARDNTITAACDGSQAWIGLVQASGNAAITSESNPNELPALSYK
jgi:outer membrane protein TolC